MIPSPLRISEKHFFAKILKFTTQNSVSCMLTKIIILVLALAYMYVRTLTPSLWHGELEKVLLQHEVDRTPL